MSSGRITRNGKIARLPKFIRDQLGQRLADGKLGKQLVEWLNGLDAVREVLQMQFGGRPISEQNLSEWKQGGYPDWLRDQETRLWVSQLTEQSGDLDEAAEGQEISDRFAAVLAAEMTELARTLLEQETDPEKRWQRLREVHRELSQLRRDDHRAVRTLIKRDRWQRETEQADEEKDKGRDQEHRERLCAEFWARWELHSTARIFGGGERGENLAAYIMELEQDLRPGSLGRKPVTQSESKSVKPQPADAKVNQPDQTESNSIKPNQTE